MNRVVTDVNVLQRPKLNSFSRFPHAEEKASAGLELVHGKYSYLFIHKPKGFFPVYLNLNIIYWKFHRILVNS